MNLDINNNKHDLKNAENYYNCIETDILTILNSYTSLLKHFMKLIYENSIKTNKINYHLFIMIRGLNTMTNVFNFIFYMTRNVDISLFYGEKSLYLYFEFVSQISSDENTFLQLNTKDAIMYVYKKTIYELNYLFVKKKEITKEEQCKLDKLNEYIKLYENMLINLFKINDNAFIKNIQKINRNYESCKKDETKNNKIKENPKIIKIKENTFGFDKYFFVKIENVFNQITNKTFDKKQLSDINLLIINKANTNYKNLNNDNTKCINDNTKCINDNTKCINEYLDYIVEIIKDK
jgi:hypothetical protein